MFVIFRCPSFYSSPFCFTVYSLLPLDAFVCLLVISQLYTGWLLGSVCFCFLGNPCFSSRKIRSILTAQSDVIIYFLSLCPRRRRSTILCPLRLLLVTNGSLAGWTSTTNTNKTVLVGSLEAEAEAAAAQEEDLTKGKFVSATFSPLPPSLLQNAQPQYVCVCHCLSYSP